MRSKVCFLVLWSFFRGWGREREERGKGWEREGTGMGEGRDGDGRGKGWEREGTGEGRTGEGERREGGDCCNNFSLPPPLPQPMKDENKRMTVIETSTGKKLTGEEAPLRSELEKWLVEHPG